MQLCPCAKHVYNVGDAVPMSDAHRSTPVTINNLISMGKKSTKLIQTVLLIKILKKHLISRVRESITTSQEEWLFAETRTK